MDRLHRKLFVCLGAAGLVLTLSACPRKPVDQRILEARDAYSLEPTGILINELEAEAAAEAAAPEVASEGVSVAAETAAVASEAASAEEAAEGEILDEEIAAPQGPRSVQVLIDLLVHFEGSGEALPGITVEVAQNDPFQKEKARHLTWVDTRGLTSGEGRQVSVSLEVDNYEDGDEFSVEWNAFVPPEKRGEYREFAEAAP